MPIFVRDQWNSIDDIVTFIVPVLVDFITMKYQGTPDSPFNTHPITIFLSIFTLLLYCSARLQAFRTAWGACAILFLRIFSFLSIAFLTALLFRGLSFFLLCLPLLILLFAPHLWGLIQKLKQRILVVAFARLFSYRGRALLPRTVADSHIM
ncbi:hypothetical protein ACJRO7_027725 [Eucalyptus globulus]|uniref:Uncharacterized protein n=1 Tax=Eucalyptus globulus TaxID=34317 RepID=A0ABD3JUM6_EUCGL